MKRRNEALHEPAGLETIDPMFDDREKSWNMNATSIPLSLDHIATGVGSRTNLCQDQSHSPACEPIGRLDADGAARAGTVPVNKPPWWRAAVCIVAVFVIALGLRAGEPLVGAGLILRANPNTQEIEIVGALENSPAARAGLRQGLILQAIDGASTEGMTLQDCVNLVRGPKGTPVVLEVTDRDRATTNRVSLIRETLHVSGTNPGTPAPWPRRPGTRDPIPWAEAAGFIPTWVIIALVGMGVAFLLAAAAAGIGIWLWRRNRARRPQR